MKTLRHVFIYYNYNCIAAGWIKFSASLPILVCATFKEHVEGIASCLAQMPIWSKVTGETFLWPHNVIKKRKKKKKDGYIIITQKQPWGSHSSFNFGMVYSALCSHAHTHSEFLSQRRSIVLAPDSLVFCVFTMLSDSSIVNILPALRIKNRHSQIMWTRLVSHCLRLFGVCEFVSVLFCCGQNIHHGFI